MKWFFKKHQTEINRPWRVYYQDAQNQLLFQHYMPGTPKVGDTVKRFLPKADYQISGVDEANRNIFVRGLVS